MKYKAKNVLFVNSIIDTKGFKLHITSAASNHPHTDTQTKNRNAKAKGGTELTATQQPAH